jgi:uncharacterized protein (TIGR02646 family)
MHKLDRGNATKPACLAQYHYSNHNWDDVSGEHKQEIRVSLIQMQDKRCAYCESAVYNNEHIEHFRRKNQLHYPKLTFEWENLFLSCGSTDTCGHYKDRPGADPYNPDHLVKPDVDDPDCYFYFHSNGGVRARSGLNSAQNNRAFETIRVFNLNNPILQAARRRSLRSYQRKEPNILEDLMDLNELDRQEYIRAEVDATKKEPHWTVIRHYFEKVI